MDRYNRLLRAACTALTAALMAGCTAYLAVCAPGYFSVSWLPVYLLAAVGAALVQLGRRSTPFAIGCLAGGCVLAGILFAAYLPDIAAFVRAAVQPGKELAAGAHAAAGVGMALIAALLLGALFAFLLQGSAGAPFALLVMLAAMICALAVNGEISLWSALPGLAAGVVAFALPGDSHRDGVRPVLLVPALVLALAAMLLSPAAHTTWEPMKNLAERVRSITEDYVRFTEERLAFSINEKGYDRAGMIGDHVVAMLGGPADPTGDQVMRVSGERNMLLRGSIKRSYTGYSWVDDAPKARYLYYDFTHRGVRNRVFGADDAKDASGFTEHSATVEMLGSGTSTLFVPAHTVQFDMNLADAVYYNSAGEIFLTRSVEAGDRYSFTASIPDSDSALISACASPNADEAYETALNEYTQLPEGIDSAVYALAVELTQSTTNPAEKALAIQNHLAKNYSYTLDGRYPDGNRDFVSWFLLEEKQGYCSYFASSMTVLCRIAGLPARYIEGYYVPAGADTLITGENAHAWTEVYLPGLGWTAFDPTARSREMHGETPPDDGYSRHGTQDEGGREGFGNRDAAEPTPTPTPDIGSSPDPTPDPGDAGLNNPESTPTPEPDGGNAPEPEDENSDSPQNDAPQDTPDDPPQQKKRSKIWLWILLALLLAGLIALAVLWVRKRLADTDPLRLGAAARSTTAAALILYRSCLTLLAQTGMAPMGGESPGAFALRASQNMPNPAFVSFADALVCSRYSGRPVSREAVKAGRDAYIAFLNAMGRSERLRFALHRIFRGLGSFENIP